MKLKVPNCLKNRISHHTVTGQSVETGMRGGTGRPVHVSEDKDSQGRAACILAAYLLLSTYLFLSYLWFSSVVFEVPSETKSALCFQVCTMLSSKPSKAT